MTLLRSTPWLIAALLALAGPALAADPKAIMGAWVEELPNGGGVVTVFTPTTISSFGVNDAGQRMTTPITKTVIYRDLGQTIGVDFDEGGGLLVAIRSPTAITLDFPDAGPRDLVPWKPPPPPKPAPQPAKPKAP